MALCNFYGIFGPLGDKRARRLDRQLFLCQPQPCRRLLRNPAAKQFAALPYRRDPVRDPFELPSGVDPEPDCIHTAMVLRKAVGNSGALSGGLKQSAEIGAGAVVHRLAGHRNQQVDAHNNTLIYTLGGKKRDAFFKVVLPGSIPILLSTAKVNIGLALVGVIIGEFLAARRGLGYLIIYGSQVFQLDMVITSIIILCIIALVF